MLDEDGHIVQHCRCMHGEVTCIGDACKKRMHGGDVCIVRMNFSLSNFFVYKQRNYNAHTTRIAAVILTRFPGFFTTFYSCLHIKDNIDSGLVSQSRCLASGRTSISNTPHRGGIAAMLLSCRLMQWLNLLNITQNNYLKNT